MLRGAHEQESCRSRETKRQRQRLPEEREKVFPTQSRSYRPPAIRNKIHLTCRDEMSCNFECKQPLRDEAVPLCDVTKAGARSRKGCRSHQISAGRIDVRSPCRGCIKWQSQDSKHAQGTRQDGWRDLSEGPLQPETGVRTKGYRGATDISRAQVEHTIRSCCVCHACARCPMMVHPCRPYSRIGSSEERIMGQESTISVKKNEVYGARDVAKTGATPGSHLDVMKNEKTRKF